MSCGIGLKSYLTWHLKLGIQLFFKTQNLGNALWATLRSDLSEAIAVAQEVICVLRRGEIFERYISITYEHIF